MLSEECDESHVVHRTCERDMIKGCEGVWGECEFESMYVHERIACDSVRVECDKCDMHCGVMCEHCTICNTLTFFLDRHVPTDISVGI